VLKLFTNSIQNDSFQQHQSGAAEAWWAHNPQVPGSKPGSDN
ncbi:Os02g0727966, partial [Oryza sativa Japonica Group]